MYKISQKRFDNNLGQYLRWSTKRTPIPVRAKRTSWKFFTLFIAEPVYASNGTTTVKILKGLCRPTMCTIKAVWKCAAIRCYRMAYTISRPRLKNMRKDFMIRYELTEILNQKILVENGNVEIAYYVIGLNGVGDVEETVMPYLGNGIRQKWSRWYNWPELRHGRYFWEWILHIRCHLSTGWCMKAVIHQEILTLWLYVTLEMARWLEGGMNSFPSDYVFVYFVADTPLSFVEELWIKSYQQSEHVVISQVNRTVYLENGLRDFIKWK